jgi:serine/threonine protein kinase
MLSPTWHSPLGATTELWATIAERLEAFGRAWELGGAPPDPAAFLHPGSPDLRRRLLLVELLKFDIDARLQRGCARPLEDYVREFPELAGYGPPVDLLYEDYHLRVHAGAAPDPRDYFDRFPDRAGELARLLGGTAAARSTAARAARVVVAVRAGERLDDFDLLTLLGEGQFAKVFLARQLTMQRLVALKVSAARGAEAQTLAQLDHPHIVRVYDQRALAARGLQLVYMPYLPGGTLLDVLAHVRTVPPGQRSGGTLLAAIDAVLVRRGEIPPAATPGRRQCAERDWAATVCALGAALASALDYAHRRGVLHRDVKPANVLLTADGGPLLADFNVGCCSKLDGVGPAALFGGSLAYMALEHLEAFDPAHPRPADALDGRADVFGLAVTLWELATGHRPFGPERLSPDRGETLAGLVAQRRRGPTPEAVSALADGSTPGLKEVLLSCLEADPDRRPATAGELQRELELCLRPTTRELVRAPSGGWRGWIRRHPLLTAYPLAVAPNLLASALNIWYNQTAIIAEWENAKTAFDQVFPIVNGLFFPLGMIVLWVAFRPVSRELGGSRPGDRRAPTDRRRARGRCLRLGAMTAGICVACWVAAGLLWPVVLRLTSGPPPQGPGAYAHFLLSLIICGLVAAAFPYFLVTHLSVTLLYPALLDRTENDPDERPLLRRVGREVGRFRAAATAVPLLAVALLASRGASSPPAVAAMSAAGLVGWALAFVLEGRTRSALTALADLPAGERNP